MQKREVIIRSPSPELLEASVVDKTSMVLRFDTNIKGPKECHTKSTKDTKSCCGLLLKNDWHDDWHIIGSIGSTKLGNDISIQ